MKSILRSGVLVAVLVVVGACNAASASTTSSPPAQTGLPTSTHPAQPGKKTTASPAQAGTDVTIDVPEGTTTRSADLYVSAKYSSTSTSAPLILSFHGYGSSGAGNGALTGLDTVADTYGVLVAYPDGLPIDPNDLSKGLHWDVDSGSVDVTFVRDLITKIKSLYRVDSSRVYATGISNGGGMTHRVGCDLADIVAAIAPVEGGYKVPGWDDCKPARPMPVMTFHGLPDPVVPYNGGEGTGVAAGHVFANVPEWTAGWAQRDSCNMTPNTTQVNSHVTKTEYSQCSAKVTVTLFTIDDNGHAWPGSSMPNASQAIDATKEIWTFFARHTLAAA